MKRIVVKITIAVALALSLSAPALAGNWNSAPPPAKTSVNWSS